MVHVKRTRSTAAGSKKAKKKSKGKTLSLNDFLSDATSGTNYVKDPPKAPATTNWADATEDLDPSGQYKNIYKIVIVCVEQCSVKSVCYMYIQTSHQFSHDPWCT